MDLRKVSRLLRLREAARFGRGIDSYDDAQSEALLRVAKDRFAAVPVRRALITEATAGIAFLLCAVAVAVWAPAGRAFSVPNLLAVGVTLYAAHRVSFAVGAAWTWPAQLVFLPMLFILPLRLVPLVSLVVGLLIVVPRVFDKEISAGQIAARCLTNTADCWYTIAPVVVLLAFSAQRFDWAHWPLYLLAFGAQVGLDATAGMLRFWFAERMVPRQHKHTLYIFLTDAALSCAGLQFAAVSSRRPGLVLLELPLIGLLSFFARERTQRMDGTLALSSAYRGTALLLGDVIGEDDEYTGEHSQAVVALSLAVAARLGLDPDALRRVEFGALLHDVGKIRQPRAILHKPGPLTPEEQAIMRLHTVYGDEMLRQVGGTLEDVGRVVRATHEHWDGSGYPDGLSGTAIPIESRIVAACDAYNAMTTDRPYRARMSDTDAEAEVRRCEGTQFDPDVVTALLEELRAAPA